MTGELFENIPIVGTALGVGPKGDKGDKGEKGDAGSVKFIVVNELPTENIDESAIYMKPSENPETQNTYEEFIYVNGAFESLGIAQVEIDLTDYVKNTDIASDNSVGVIKIPIETLLYTTPTGFLYAYPLTYAQYTTTSDYGMINKGTLENVITGKGLVSNTDYATKTTGGVLKVSDYFDVEMNNVGEIKAKTRTYNYYSNSSPDTSFISKGTLENVLNNRFVTLTQTQYDNLATKDENTYYYIVEE